MWLTLVNTAALSLSSSLSAQVIFFELILFVIVFFSFLMNCRMMGEVMSCIKGQVRVCYIKLALLIIYGFVRISFNIPAPKLTPI